MIVNLKIENVKVIAGGGLCECQVLENGVVYNRYEQKYIVNVGSWKSYEAASEAKCILFCCGNGLYGWNYEGSIGQCV